MNAFDWRTLVPFFVLVVIAVVYWWVIIRPQAIAHHRHRRLVDELKVGDHIVTAGGIHGKVLDLDDDTFTLHVGGDMRLTFDRKAVRRRLDG